MVLHYETEVKVTSINTRKSSNTQDFPLVGLPTHSMTYIQEVPKSTKSSKHTLRKHSGDNQLS